jgi:ubiquinone/menaquinone biosynthesis C-methylase UbiE
VSQAYFNDKARMWDEIMTEKDASRLEAMAARLDIKPGTTVLDVGTGTGVFVPFLLKKTGQEGNLVCLDYAEEMLKLARAKGFKGNISYICADIEDSRLTANFFDAVVCYSSFPHIKNKPRALDEINRITKAGGQLIICHTSSRENINQTHRGIPLVSDDLLPEENEARRMLSTAGFNNIKIEDREDSYFVVAVKSNLQFETDIQDRR